MHSQNQMNIINSSKKNEKFDQFKDMLQEMMTQDLLEAMEELQKAFDFQPKSMRIPVGDGKSHQFNFTGFDPIAMIMGMASDSGKIVEMALQDNDQAARDATAHALALTLAFGENIANSTFMMGMSKANRDLTHWNRVKENPEARGKFAEEWFNRYTSSFIPTAARQTGKFFNDDFNKIAIGEK